MCIYIYIYIQQYTCISLYICISLDAWSTWTIRSIWRWFPLLTMIPLTWGRYVAYPLGIFSSGARQHLSDSQTIPPPFFIEVGHVFTNHTQTGQILHLEFTTLLILNNIVWVPWYTLQSMVDGCASRPQKKSHLLNEIILLQLVIKNESIWMYNTIWGILGWI